MRTPFVKLIVTFAVLHNINYLMEISAYLEKISGFFVGVDKPVTGPNAFTHKSGVHTNGVLKDPHTYEPFDPSMLGRERKIVIDKYTGKRAVAARLDEYGVKFTPDELKKTVEAIKSAKIEPRSIFAA
jgi:isopropylmalate/homocitrate/citramalate synthase